MSGAMRAARWSRWSGHAIRSGWFRGFGVWHAAWVAGFAFLFEFLGQIAWLDLRAMSFARFPEHLAICFAAILSAVAADNAVTHRRLRFLRYPLAVLLASVVVTVVCELWTTALFPRFDKERAAMELLVGGRFAFLGLFVTAAYMSALVVAFHALFEAQRRASAELHAARMVALNAQQDVIEGDLRAMQARIDPELLFDALLEVDRAYAHDVGSGQERLDALIRFLRAALPGEASGSTTVAREQELAEAYVALVGGTMAPELVTEISVDPAARNDSIPAMMLLPLVRWALQGWQAVRFGVRVRRQGARIELAVESSGPACGSCPDREIDGVRERLSRLYADGARLDARSGDGLRRAVLEVPLAPAAAL